jgi:hypothetical protein
MPERELILTQIRRDRIELRQIQETISPTRRNSSVRFALIVVKEGHGIGGERQPTSQNIVAALASGRVREKRCAGQRQTWPATLSA